METASRICLLHVTTSNWADVGCPGPLLALGHVVFDFLSLAEFPISIGLNRAVVDEDIDSAIFRSNESEAFSELNHFTMPFAIFFSMPVRES